MRDLARLSDHAMAEIDALIADGISLTPQEIVEINALAWAVEAPGERLALSRGVPIFPCDSVALWPLTMAGHDWISRVGCRLSSPRLRRLATCYAMAHAYSDRSALEVDGRAAERAVLRWADGLGCRESALYVAAQQVLDQDDEARPPADDDAPGMGLGELSAWLSAATGLPADEFERRMSFNHSLRLFHFILSQQDRAEGRRAADAERVSAERTLGLKLQAIRRGRHGSEN